MSSKNDRFSSYSTSSFSSSSSSSQLSTPRAFQNGYSRAISKSPIYDVENVRYSYGFTMPKSNEELIGEIEDLQTEISQLERYLLSLYRSSFGDHLPALLLPNDSSMCLKTSPLKPYTTKFHKDRDSSVSDMSVSSNFKLLSETVNDLNLQTHIKSNDKIKRSESAHPSLADLLGLNTISPNKLSEDILRLICVIHFKLSDNGHNRLVKNLKNEDAIEECGPEHGVVIHKFCLDEDNLKSVEILLQNFRSLVQKLEKVDPTRMAQEEKLAFWINIHNALVMHAYIVCGISEDTRRTMILKAGFNIGGEKINAYDVKCSILGIRTCHSKSRLQTLFSPARSSKTSSGRHIYAVDYSEPFLHFVLSTGASSDPMVRVYTAEGIFQELRQARDDFIQTSIGFEETRIVLPKIIYNYAKDTSFDMAELFSTISECLTETQRSIMRRVMKKKQERCIRWINHDSSFRYIIHWELVRESLNLTTIFCT